jgi:D-alanyl-D-alanine carboxypeptidase/D-alanyl-D-alanine-endopeptidase (penicillin-binding protein 4)
MVSEIEEGPQPRRTAKNVGVRRGSAGPAETRTTFFAKNSSLLIASALGVVFLMLGTGAIFAGAALGDSSPDSAPSAEPVAESVRVAPAELPAAMRLRTCSVADLAADARLMTLRGYVMNASTGEVLFDHAGTKPARTASVMKVLTAAAALATLGPDFRVSTTVIDGSRPGSIVLVGGGDITLGRSSGNSVYPGAAKISALASAARTQYETLHPGVPITEVVLDATLWNDADRWDSSWDRKEMNLGYHSEITALQVDGDRDNPAQTTSVRSRDAIGRAGSAFVDALGIAGVTVTRGAAVSGTVLAQVQSQPVRELIGQMLPNSDNALAEMLGRLISLNQGLDGSAASLTGAYASALAAYDIPTTGIVIRDGSGLSHLNAVPASYAAALMATVLGGGQNLSIIYGALPVAGRSGTLSSRFTGASAVARGAVTAKTGWIDTAYTLAGAVNAADGSVLTFAFFAIGDGIRPNAKEAIDSLVAGVFTCGDNLSNN